MIKSFKCGETARIFNGQISKDLPPEIQSTARRKLLMLDAAGKPVDLIAPPGNRLEKPTGVRDGQYSIRINDQWRICFKWDDGVTEVEIVDYH